MCFIDTGFICGSDKHPGNTSLIGVCFEPKVRVKVISSHEATVLLNGTREEKDITLTSPLVIARLYQLARALSEGCLILNVHIESI